MDFIHYNPGTEPLLVYNESSADEMDMEDIIVQYGQIETLAFLD
jgi:hypothetical protein